MLPWLAYCHSCAILLHAVTAGCFAAAAAELLDSGTDGPIPAKQQSPSVPPSVMHANYCVHVLLVVAAAIIA